MLLCSHQDLSLPLVAKTGQGMHWRKDMGPRAYLLLEQDLLSLYIFQQRIDICQVGAVLQLVTQVVFHSYISLLVGNSRGVRSIGNLGHCKVQSTVAQKMH